MLMPVAEERAAVLAQIRALAAGVPGLPADADRTPGLPHTGGVPGQWVNASGRSATDTGVVLYVHGGGFADTEPAAERLLAHRLSRATGRPAFAVDYRLAPTYPFPAALDDVAAAYRSVVEQVPASGVLLFGESAGATIVLSLLLTLARSGERMPAGAAVVSPLTDLTLSGPSLTTNDGSDTIDRAVLARVVARYLAGARPDAAPQSPLHGDLAGLPPLLVAAGSAEVLLDDARRLAAAATAAGVEVTLDVYEGMPHAFHLAALPDAPLTTTATFLCRLADWTRDGRR